MTNTDVLFQPFTLKGVTFRNRIAMAPMTRSKSPNQVPNEQVAAYYRARAEGGTGLILTEGTSPEHKSASNDANVPGFFGEASLAGWANVVKEVKAVGGHIMPQLWHQGVIRHPGSGPYPEEPTMSPSGLAKKDKKVAEPMTDSQIADVISGFAKSAGYAKKLGFDGVELHGAHGYLIDQFFWEETNQRDDHHAGGIGERTKFAANIVKAVQAEVGEDFPILLRFSQWKQQDFGVKLAQTPHELEQFLRPLVDAGIDMFHCSTRRFWEPEFEGSDMNLAGWTKKLTGIPTMSVGSVSLNVDFITSFTKADTNDSGLDKLVEMIERGDFDMIAVGRALIANPDWANKVRAGKVSELKNYSPESLATLV
ncbi:MAG TPA: NADH:flavin oxidoreductase [Rhizomicrobium sp.]|jgi:2,4-dienoyl-CoA reductase-like NADH-dependent reductase (Old Yellow Enzyme family)|nr:NADH:flavin oxidoreductase [Rhizomicrobium sp.]